MIFAIYAFAHSMNQGLSRRLAAEALGTAGLLATVVGSGIMGDQLAGGNIALALMANAIATGAMLAVLIITLGPISGAHFNPVVTLVTWRAGRLPARDAGLFIVAQTLAGVAGVMLANVMFGEPLVAASTHVRTGGPQWLSEFVATFGLIATIVLCVRARPQSVPWAVGAYIVAAYWFTPSTSFANPAVTAARSLTNTFAGIRPIDVGPFIVVQIVAALVASVVLSWLAPEKARNTAGVS